MNSMGEQSEKSHERGRLTYWIQHIGKFVQKSSKKATPEDINQIRYATSKLHQNIQSTDRNVKDNLIKNTPLVETLISLLQIINCEQCISNAVHIFIDMVGRTQSARRASALINHGLSTVLLQMLKLQLSNDISLPDDVLVAMHILLARLSFKDRKLAVKARLYQSLLLTVNLIKSNLHQFRYLQPLLTVLKIYTNNSVNASYLGKHNAVALMFKVITACGKRHTIDLKLALENLFYLTRSKGNSARLIGMGGVVTLLALYSEWQQLDTKHRNLAVQKAILKVLKNITNLQSGRKAFTDADGIRILYNSSAEANDCREMEGLIMLSSVILRKCYPRNKLPLENSLSPKLWPLPTSSAHVPECFFLPGFPYSHQETVDPITAEDSDHSSLDDDDDIDSDDERFRTDQEEPDDGDHWDGIDPAEKRTPEELRIYDSFFPELFEVEAPPSSTALPQLQWSVSDTFCGQGLASYSQSTNNISSRADSAHGKYNKRTSLDFTTTPRYFTSHSSTDSEPMDRTVSAINLKTGLSVISFDPMAKTVAAMKSKGLPKGRAKKKMPLIKDKRMRKSLKPYDQLSDSFSSISFNAGTDVDDSDQATQSSNEELEDEFREFGHDSLLFAQMAADTQSVYTYVKLPFPDLYGIKGNKMSETLLARKFGVQRAKIFEDIDRMIHPEYILDRVVYNLDMAIKDTQDTFDAQSCNLSNRDELRIGYVDEHFHSLKFNSQFECGNLRKAIQVREYEYDLILNPDVNSNHHHQWFYFEVSNMEADMPYRFNIVNCEKINSQFNFGMQPLLMSVMEATKGNPMWVRTGSDICYYKNHFLRHPNTTGGVKGKAYYTTTFTLTFPHAGDICYISYHYPYSYTMLKMHINLWDKLHDPSLIYFKQQSLCKSLGGNSVPVLTITAQLKGNDKDSLDEFRSRPYIFLSSRVHPGESNASWIMKGTIDFLLSRRPQAQQVREMYIFKIVPMLNPDGVLNGNHRSSLVGEDLNRRWAKPCSTLHPSIYHTKGLLLYLNMVNKTPMVYCDYHGHSRRKNIFLYGCSPVQSWIPNDIQNPCVGNGRPNDCSYKNLPRLLNMNSPCFSLQNCSYAVERVKETTARVVVWRHIGVVRSYTMESSYCGLDQGKYKDMHMSTHHLEEMGHKFCETLIKLGRQKGSYDQQQPVFDDCSSNTTSLDDFSNLMTSAGEAEPSNAVANPSETDDEDEDEEEEEFDDDM